MQNCNIGPDTMLIGSPLTRDKYPDYIYGAGPNESNSRGRRAVELLDAEKSLTLERAMEIALDTHADGADEWQAALAAAAEAFRDDGRLEAVRPALTLLAAWNGHMDAESPAATLYRALREQLKQAKFDGGRVRRGETLSRDEQEALLQGLAGAVKYLREMYGRLEVPWGDVHRVRRGDRSWPVSGGDSGGGSTLRAVGTHREGNVFYGRSGQSWTQVVLLNKGAVESYSATPYGQSDHPDSPHYTDQAEKLYSRLRLKPTYFQREALEGHIASRTELEFVGQ
jgi:acyl-homoserine-lactone acylase